MASSGLFGRPNSGSKGFDFASDDILCSYEDYGAQDRSNGNFSDPTIVVSPSKVYSVINYVLPVKHEYPSEPDYVVYLHRIGRAGHFGYRPHFSLLLGFMPPSLVNLPSTALPSLVLLLRIVDVSASHHLVCFGLFGFVWCRWEVSDPSVASVIHRLEREMGTAPWL